MWLPAASKEKLKMVPAEEESHRERRLSSQPAGSLFLHGWMVSLPQPLSLYTGDQKAVTGVPGCPISLFNIGYEIKQ